MHSKKTKHCPWSSFQNLYSPYSMSPTFTGTSWVSSLSHKVCRIKHQSCSMDITHIRHAVWTSGLQYGHQTCSMDIRLAVWTSDMQYGHQTCSMDIRLAVWTSDMQYGHQTCSMGIRHAARTSPFLGNHHTLLERQCPTIPHCRTHPLT